jgi:hypothetical protein
MRVIETLADVSEEHRLSLDLKLPADVPPGKHRVVVVIEQQPAAAPAGTFDFPVIDTARWPDGLSLCREDMYGDDGR